MKKMLRLASLTIALTGALAVLPASADAEFFHGAPVSMTDQGLKEWESRLPDEDVISDGIYRAASECECETLLGRKKAVISYFDGLFHHYGYDYGNTVTEYIAAYYREGEYRGKALAQLEPSGMHSYIAPAITLITDGQADWLVDEWVMGKQAMSDSKALLSVD